MCITPSPTRLCSVFLTWPKISLTNTWWACVTCFSRWRQCSREETCCPPSANVRICNSVSRLPSSSLGLGGWSLGHLRNIKNLALGELPFAGGLVLLLAASMLWRAFPMALTGAGLVLILQEIADPSPLFFTVPWEALEFVLSRKVRANHFWLHRTQGLLRESGGSLRQGNLAEPFGGGEARDPAVPVVQEEFGFPCAANAGAGVERGLNQMSVRSRLLAEAEKQTSNTFLLCALVSLRTRQFMMTG